MLTERDIVARVQHVTVTRLTGLGAARLDQARRQGRAKRFSEADMARAALIRDLEDKLGFDEDQVPVLLNLIDQIHGLRAELKTMLDALEALPEEVRATVKMRITKRKPKSRR